MLIHRMADALSWADDAGEVWRQVHGAYNMQLADALGATLGRLRRLDAARSATVADAMMALPAASFDRVLLAPETSSRLLWRRNYDDGEILDFLEAAVRAETEALAPDEAGDEACWTALGDERLTPDGRRRQPQIAGFPALDLISPHARRVHLDGERIRLSEPREELPLDARRVVLRRCGKVAASLNAMGAEWGHFLKAFTKVFVVQPDPDAPRAFSSGTSAQFIGRSVLANAHLPSVSLEVIADGVIHETIHGLLYMQEQQRAWVFDDALYGGERRVVSPWTGAHLALRPYMQAAFVWYGLLHFWARALAQGQFDSEQAQERLVVAARGFQRTPLIDQLQPYAKQIAPELIEAIGEMQARVEGELDGAMQ